MDDGDTAAYARRGARTSDTSFTGGAVEPLGWKQLLFPSKLITAALIVVCLVLPTLLVIEQIRKNPALSPADEYAHLDYVVRLTKGEVPRTGDLLDPRTLRIEACAGIALRSVSVPRCKTKVLRPIDFPGNGYNHEAQQPPVYYAITAAFRGAAERLTGDQDFLGVARAGGVFWFILALLLTWAAGRSLGASPWALLAALLVLASAPAVIYYSSIVSNDATALFSGALVFVVAARVGLRPNRMGVLTLFAAGALCAALKPTNAIVILAVAIFLGSRLASHGAGWGSFTRDWMKTGGILVLGALVPTVLWVVISGSIATKDATALPIYFVRHVSGFHLDTLLAEATNLLSPATGTVPPGTLTHPIQAFSGELVRVLFIVAALSGLFVARRAWYHVLGLASVAALLIGGLGYGIVVLLTLSMDPGTGSRYGLSVLPILTVGLALLAARGRVVWLVAGIGAITACSTLFVLFTTHRPTF
jgi:hypothetical protein